MNYAKNGDEKKLVEPRQLWNRTCDSLHQKVNALNNDSLKIDPTSIFGATYSNWLDGFVAAPGAIVDLILKV